MNKIKGIAAAVMILSLGSLAACSGSGDGSGNGGGSSSEPGFTYTNGSVTIEMNSDAAAVVEKLGEPLDLSVIDVSFISLKLVLPAIRALLKPETGQVLCLIKPQFEAGKEKVGKKGVVRDPAVHREVLESFVETARELRFSILNLTFSPVKGPEGNIEFLAHLTLAGGESRVPDLTELVAQAHEALKG